MKIAVFSTKPYDKEFLNQANKAFEHTLAFLEPHLSKETVALAAGFQCVCVFVNDWLDAAALRTLHEHGTSLVALRCAGYNNVDLAVARDLGMAVVRVPAYSPYAVAEHAVALMMALNRKIYRAYNRVKEGNFSLEGLMGFDMKGKTVGIIGTGKIGAVVARILHGFGCTLLAYDPYPDSTCQEKLGVRYVDLPELLTQSDIITLHCPLTPQTYHLIDEQAVAKMKPGVMLINTSRGTVIETTAVIRGLKSEKIGYLGLDVYEEEADLFFEDLSGRIIQDDVFTRLLTFPNVVVTGHQGFFTREALENIAQITLANVTEFERTGACANQIFPSPEKVA